MSESLLSVTELAEQLHANASTMRAWMRRQGWRHPIENGTAWILTPIQIAELRERYGHDAPAAVEQEETSLMDEDATEVVGSELATLTVGELLSSYSEVLIELRRRGLVRTSNAPIGDLAEYCSALVYGGTLAPNSEKSFDLTAADGRRIQVKVRLIRTGTSRAAVFSPLRSFGFDACIFMLIDDLRQIVTNAQEWTVDEVRQHGRHREHTNGTVVRVSQVRTSGIGIDRTEEFDAHWKALLKLLG